MAATSESLLPWLQNTTDGMDDNTTATTMAPAKPDFFPIRAMYFYAMGLVIPIGLFCNLLALTVFAKSPTLRRTVTGHYLMALAIADTVFLIGDFIRWLNPSMKDFYMGMNFLNTSNEMCKITYFVRYFGKFASAWVTVAITAQRFLTVVKAMEVARIATAYRVKVILVFIGIVSLALNVFPFWTIGVLHHEGRHICAIRKGTHYDTWNTAIMRVGGLILPAVIIMVLTAIIVVDLIKAGHRRRTNLNVRRSSSSSSLVMERHLSAMLVAVALAFLCLRLPYAVTYYLNEYKEEMWEPLDLWHSHRIYCATKVTDIIATLNYAINFFLYCLCGSTFRKHLVAMFPCNKNKELSNRRKNLTVTTSLKTSNGNNTSIRFQTIKTQTENPSADKTESLFS